jgi:hypothetical protein
MAYNVNGFTVAPNNAPSILPAAVEFKTGITGVMLPTLNSVWVRQFTTLGHNAFISTYSAGLCWYNPDVTKIQFGDGLGVVSVNVTPV